MLREAEDLSKAYDEGRLKPLIPTTQYKKDLKRYATQRKKMEALRNILLCLAEERPLEVFG